MFWYERDWPYLHEWNCFIHLKKTQSSIFNDKDDNKMESNCMRILQCADALANEDLIKDWNSYQCIILSLGTWILLHQFIIYITGNLKFLNSLTLKYTIYWKLYLFYIRKLCYSKFLVQVFLWFGKETCEAVLLFLIVTAVPCRPRSTQLPKKTGMQWCWRLVSLPSAPLSLFSP